MHIVFVTTEFVTEKFYCGGLSNFTANMARIFRRRGHEVTVLVAAYYRKKLVWEDGIRVECVNCVPELTASAAVPEKLKRTALYEGAMVMAGSYFVKRSLERIDGRKRIDLIHYCNLQALGLFAPDKPYVVRLSSYNNLWKGAYRREFTPDYAKNRPDVTDRLEEAAVKHAMAVISPTFLLADITGEFLGKKAKVLESPYFFDSGKADTDWYDKTLSGKKYFLFYGTLGYMKGAHIIADIIYKLLDERRDYYFVLVGSRKTLQDDNGREMPADKRIVEKAGPYADRVIYHDSMNRQMLTPVIKNAELVFLPSRIDNLPNTCIEAMALKKIVIGTRGASFEQLIRHGYSGFLGERDEPESYLSCIREALALGTEERERMGERASARCRRLEPDCVYHNYLKFYEEVIDFYNSRKSRRKTVSAEADRSRNEKNWYKGKKII